MDDKFRKKEARRAIRKWLSTIKTACSNCGESRIATLDFHHLDQRTKSIEINEAIRMRWSQSSIQKEVDKCKILCANCHRCEHSGRFATPHETCFDNYVTYAKGVRL